MKRILDVFDYGFPSLYKHQDFATVTPFPCTESRLYPSSCLTLSGKAGSNSGCTNPLFPESHRIHESSIAFLLSAGNVKQPALLT